MGETLLDMLRPPQPATNNNMTRQEAHHSPLTFEFILCARDNHRGSHPLPVIKNATAAEKFQAICIRLFYANDSKSVQSKKETDRLWPMRLFRPLDSLRIWLHSLALLAACFLLFSTWQSRAGAGGLTDVGGHLNKHFQETRDRFLANTNDAEAAWQFSRACFDLADIASNNTQRAEFANQGITAGRRAVALNDRSAEAHYYLGMNAGELADTKRNLSALRMVKDMERDFLAALALDEHLDYAGPDRNLGLLYRDAPSIVSIGSRTKARQHLERAVELAPDFPENHLNLIESYLKWDYRNEAAKQLGELEKVWAVAQKKYTGNDWAPSWPDWNKRFGILKKKIEGTSKVNESPRSSDEK